MNHNNKGSFGIRRRSLVFSRVATIPDIEKLFQEVKSLTLEQVRILMDRLQKELGVIAVSFTPTGVVVGGGTAGVATKVTLVVEKKMTLTLMLVMVVVVTIVQK